MTDQKGKNRKGTKGRQIGRLESSLRKNTQKTLKKRRRGEPSSTEV